MYDERKSCIKKYLFPPKSATADNCAKIIRKELQKPEPSMIARFGSNEIKSVLYPKNPSICQVDISQESFSPDTFNDTALSLTRRLGKMMQPKGLPPSAWRVFTQKHTGILWPIYLCLL